jgi:hypothetical protein
MQNLSGPTAQRTDFYALDLLRIAFYLHPKAYYMHSLQFTHKKSQCKLTLRSSDTVSD